MYKTTSPESLLSSFVNKLKKQPQYSSGSGSGSGGGITDPKWNRNGFINTIYININIIKEIASSDMLCFILEKYNIPIDIKITKPDEVRISLMVPYDFPIGECCINSTIFVLAIMSYGDKLIPEYDNTETDLKKAFQKICNKMSTKKNTLFDYEELHKVIDHYSVNYEHIFDVDMFNLKDVVHID